MPSCADLSWNELQKEIQIRQRPEILTLSLQRVIGALDADCNAILNGDPRGAPSLLLSPTTFEEELKEARCVGRSVLNYIMERDGADLQEDGDIFARALLWAGRAYWLYMYKACPDTKKGWKWVKTTLEIEFGINLALQATPTERGYDSDHDVLAIHLESLEDLEVEVPVQPQMQSVVHKVEPARKAPQQREPTRRAPQQQEPARRALTKQDITCYKCWKAGHRFSECPEQKRIKSLNRRRGRRGS